ncbi:RICIN domain-containing protein [Streptomyces goshikiensis]|uniref:RICIN domain-containing protein n=1 Tax=Streptomyces goshikiensis TaxID=1942 RepID=UPI0036556FF5
MPLQIRRLLPGAAALAAVMLGASPPTATAVNEPAPATDAPITVEDGAYPDSDAVLSATGVKLVRGDGGITHVPCDTPHQIAVWARPVKLPLYRICFSAPGASGYLALTVADAFRIETTGRDLRASLTTDGKNQTVNVKRDTVVGVGEGADPDSKATLLELRVTGSTTAPPQPPTGANALTPTGKLQIGDTRSCTGTLVGAQWMLTAASCFSDGGAPVPAGKPALKTTVTVGRTYLTGSTSTVVDAVELVPHANRDLVMVKLAWRVVGVDPVPVASAPPVTGEQLTSYGFGRTRTEWAPSKLHSAVLNVSSVTGPALSLSPSGDTVVCKGDAGAPALRINGSASELVAVNSRSWQGGCHGGNPDETRGDTLGVRVDDVAAWITQVRDTTPSVRLQTLVPATTGVMTSADFNRDGRTDLAAVTADGNLHTFAGRADGTFEYGRPLWAMDGSWSTAKKIIGGDFNGDGLSDIASVWANGTLRLYAGQQDGSLAGGKPMWTEETTNWNAMAQLARYKVDGSGRDGLLAVWGAGDSKGALYGYYTGTNGLLSGTSRQLWRDTSWLGVQKIATGDLNGDGRDDVVAIASDGALRRYSGNADGGLDDGVSMWSNNGWNNMPVMLSGDFNGDGKTDLGGLWSNQQRFNFYQGDGQGVIGAGTTAWPSPVPVPAKGQIRNVNSGKCLEITNSSKDNSALAQQWTCGAQASAQWEFRPSATTGVYQIVNVNSGKCLEIINSSKDNGARAQQYTCKDIPTMQWTIKQAGSTVSLDIRNVNSGKTLEISNSSKDNGGAAQQWDHAADPSHATQSWYV